MYSCPLCRHLSKSVKSYIDHFRLHRNIPNFKIPCPYQHCLHTLSTHSALRSHVARKHCCQSRRHNELELQIREVALVCKDALCRKICISRIDLIKHLKEHIKDGGNIACPYKNCSSNYTKLGSFKAHISRMHRNETVGNIDDAYKHGNISSEPLPDRDISDENESMEVEEVMHLGSDNIQVSEDNDDNSEVDYSSILLEDIALFYLKLQAEHLIPASTIQKIHSEFQNLHEISRDQVVKKLTQQLAACNINDDKISEIIDDIVDNDHISNAHNGPLRTTKCRNTFYKKNLHYIDPVEIFLGHDDNHKELFSYFIPISESIKSLMKHCGDAIHFDIAGSHGTVLSDIGDGRVLKQHTLFNSESNSFKIILYQDSFEVVNPLGASKGKHKLLAVYFTLANFPPAIRSSIHHIQLVMLCKEKIVKYVGPNKVFRCIVDDLQTIEHSGIEVENKGCIKGTIACIAGDNLGSHQIGGFTENFSTTPYFCRYCTITREEFRECPHSVGDRRSVESYEDCIVDIQNGAQMSMGIKRQSVFNELEYFHVCAPGLPPCLAHDLFEGVVAFDMALYIQYFVLNKWFTYAQLNRHIVSFKYSRSDALDKPPEVKHQASRLSGNAVQNWVFLRLFVLIIKHLIQDYDDPVWKAYTTLKTVVELVCAPQMSLDQLSFLQITIEDYLHMRHTQFPDHTLRPKHHYLAHYPDLVYEFGPLIRLWTLRFESKHTYFKRCARRLQNFKNLPKTLSKQHQLLQAYFTKGSLWKSKLQCQSSLAYCSESLSDSIINAITVCDSSITKDNTVVSHKVTLNGVIYEKGLYVFVEACPEGYSVGKINFILVKDSDHVYFVLHLSKCYCIPIKGLCEVHESSSQLCTSVENLLDYNPLPAYYFNGTVLCLKHALG